MRPGSERSQVLVPAETSGKLIHPDEIFRTIENFYPTEEGGLISMVKPISLFVDGNGDPPEYALGNEDAATPIYGELKGVFHARCREGQRDILLLHTGGEVWEFTGWTRGWRPLLGPTASSPLYITQLQSDEISDFPTQFPLGADRRAAPTRTSQAAWPCQSLASTTSGTRSMR